MTELLHRLWIAGRAAWCALTARNLALPHLTVRYNGFETSGLFIEIDSRRRDYSQDHHPSALREFDEIASRCTRGGLR